MAPLTVIAKLKARAGSEEALYEACLRLIAPTVAEEGCLNYDMHRSVEDPSVIMFYENWTTRPLWEQHMQAPHLTEFSAATEGMTEVWELFLGERVSEVGG